ncbi:dihydroorotate dehydrogenase [Robertmurraya sp. P23]|uniref:dihydroorotate dehydrogenase n=1 Tax=Robertmurraya sp. P23 TaxID=3436931 RepID=UPI003D95D6A4
MPDWSYHPLFKSLLFRMPGTTGREFIHKGMNIIANLPGGPFLIEFLGHMKPSFSLQKTLFGLSFSNPVGLSGRIDPQLSGTKAFSNLGFGFIEIGPVTLEAQHPNVAATYDRKSQNILFPVVDESIGLRETIVKIGALGTSRKPILFRISKSSSFQDCEYLLKSLIPYGDIFIFENSFHEEQWKQLRMVSSSKPILLSIPAHLCSEFPISAFVKKQWIDGIIIEEASQDNGEYREYPQHSFPMMLEVLQKIKKNTPRGFPVIISGGIYEPQDAFAFFESGADLVMVTGGYVLAGPGLPKRINEGLIKEEFNPPSNIGWLSYWLFGLIMLIAGVITLLISMTVVMLPYDEAFIQLTREQLQIINPRILSFMTHDRMTLAGTMISGGFLYMQLAKHGVRKGYHWAKRAINIGGITGFIGILLFIGYGYFDWLHGLLWLFLFPFFFIGFRNTKYIRETSYSRNLTNHRAWRRSLWGQLSFVILGVSFVIGGLLISIIGATNVFVATDLVYICMTPEQLESITNKLIPVIAHDRAGFGSALLSVGLLVLMLSLWGFHEGDRWVWVTFLAGGTPAFISGIATHFVIGYTTFLHLLPAYFALFLFLVGIICSKDYLCKKEGVPNV